MESAHLITVKYIGKHSGGAVFDRVTRKRITYVRGYTIEVSEELADELLDDQNNSTVEWVEVRKRD